MGAVWPKVGVVWNFRARFARAIISLAPPTFNIFLRLWLGMRWLTKKVVYSGTVAVVLWLIQTLLMYSLPNLTYKYTLVWQLDLLTNYWDLPHRQWPSFSQVCRELQWNSKDHWTCSPDTTVHSEPPETCKLHSSFLLPRSHRWPFAQLLFQIKAAPSEKNLK